MSSRFREGTDVMDFGSKEDGRLIARKRRDVDRRKRLPENPNKRTTVISADRSLARLKEENRRVIYGY